MDPELLRRLVRRLEGIAEINDESEQWKKHSIYRVPPHIRELNSQAYKKRVVSLGAFNSLDSELRSMTETKLRAFKHLVRRTGKPVRAFSAAVYEVIDELLAAYMDLEVNHEGVLDKVRDLVLDGCFILEVMRSADRNHTSDYATNDPIFSKRGILYMHPYIRHDMLLIENQLPLLLLERLHAVASGKSPDEVRVDMMVVRFLSPTSQEPLPVGCDRGLHPLDVLRKSLLHRPHYCIRISNSNCTVEKAIHSAVELYELGIKFKKSETNSLRDIQFNHGLLTLPLIVVDDMTEHMFLNMMVFERLHPDVNNGITAYVFFMDSIVNSAEDVKLLRSKGIIQNNLGSNEAVANLFNSISHEVVLDPDSNLEHVHQEMSKYCRRHVRIKLKMWYTNLINTYFRNPWTSLSVAAATLLLVLAIVQTVYTVWPFYRNKA